jgi:branched-chain amino acid transport system permease protein
MQATFLQYFFDALSLGSLYALGALGIALIFGVMRLVNFAHGDVIAFCVFSLIIPGSEALVSMGIGALPAVVLVPAILLIGAALSVTSEVLVFRKLRKANGSTMMIASFALGFVIQNTLLMFYGSRPKAVNLWPDLNLPIDILGARVPILQSLTVGISAVVLLGLVWLLKRCRIGLEMRAAAEDFTMARMLGVHADRVIMLSFAISGMLAATIGLLMITQTGVADIRMGAPVMLVAFIATVIGGLGSLPGAVMAGFLMGAVSILLQAILPLEVRPFRDAFVYLAVIAILIARPQGLFISRSTTQRI